MSLAENIRYLRKKQGWSQDYLAEKLGYKSYTTIQKWESGVSEPPLKKAHEIANLFQVDVDDLSTRNLSKEESCVSPDFNLQLMPERTGQGFIRIPVLGSIPAGTPIEAIQDIIDWEDISSESVGTGQEYFALKVSGDSMYPEYLTGDTVIVRRQTTCISGDDCVVYVNGYDATLKTVKLNPDGSLTLRPINPSYPPRTYSTEEVQNLPVSIAGVVVEIRRKKKSGWPMP